MGRAWHTVRTQPKINLIVAFCIALVGLTAVLSQAASRDLWMEQEQQQESQQQQALLHIPSPSSYQQQPTLRTVAEIKATRMALPCNYVHDGFYITDSNEIVNQVYQTLMQDLRDDDIPVVIECGGHDGITKSQTLKASRCLGVNTLLIEASPTNYNVLRQTRGSFDWTVHGALCDGPSIELVENAVNSGETHILNSSDKKRTKTVSVNCTSIDAQLDTLKATLPANQQDKLKVIMLVLDVEGFEATAIHGVQRYRPHKVFMEEKHLHAADRAAIAQWADGHSLHGRMCNKDDTCYNFGPLIGELQQQSKEYLKSLFYGARWGPPKHSVRTNVASQSYMFYGE